MFTRMHSAHPAEATAGEGVAPAFGGSGPEEGAVAAQGGDSSGGWEQIRLNGGSAGEWGLGSGDSAVGRSHPSLGARRGSGIYIVDQRKHIEDDRGTCKTCALGIEEAVRLVTVNSWLSRAQPGEAKPRARVALGPPPPTEFHAIAAPLPSGAATISCKNHCRPSLNRASEVGMKLMAKALGQTWSTVAGISTRSWRERKKRGDD
uniref:Uncharacterized protein n=1 Tax=Oryza punctata TaxID=4537 RepID=A0A0E0MM40_ORYPU